MWGTRIKSAFYALAMLGLGLWPGLACAQAGDIVGPDAFDGSIDLRASVVGGETGWLESGFGKLRWGGDNGESQARARIAAADLAWKPRFTFNLSGLVSVVHQAGQSNDVDLNEAFLSFRSNPAATRVSARAGVLWPPISLEHGGSTWQVADSITPSAVNSWVGEEVKVLAFEGKVEHRFADQTLAITAALFKHDDMAGTLLTYRGWALHDVRTGVRTAFDLPPLSRFAANFQPDETYPFREIDRRPGYYGRIEWRPPAPVALHAFFYDNGGDRTSIDSHKQWSWETRFFEAGLRWQPTDDIRVLAQALNGETVMGYSIPGGRWFDMGFQSGYALVQRAVGSDTVSGRIDGFRTRDRTFRTIDDNQENGWAATASWRHRLAPHVDLILEAQHVASKRNARRLAGEDPKQDQTVLQSAVRLSF